MSAPPDPRKLKAHLVALREFLPAPPSEPGGGDAKSDEEKHEQHLDALTQSYLVLWGAELAQRGALAGSLSWGDNEEERSKTLLKLVETIQATCGRALLLVELQTSSKPPVPRPLVANACSLAALAAERCCDFLFQKQEEDSLNRLDLLQKSHHPAAATTSSSSSSSSSSSLDDLWALAKQRCVDVQDERFACLLRLRKFPSKSSSSSSSSFSAKSETAQQQVQVWASLFLQVAVGQHLRAATFANEDQPQPWKRCLDAVLRLRQTSSGGGGGATTTASWGDKDLLQSLEEKSVARTASTQAPADPTYDTIEAVVPLLELIRVAHLKGNEKRANELYFFLSSSYLSALPDFDYHDAATASSLSLWQGLEHEIRQAFSLPFLGNGTPADLVRSVMAEAAAASNANASPLAIPQLSSSSSSSKTGRLLARQLVEAAREAFGHYNGVPTLSRRVQGFTIALAQQNCLVWTETEDAFGAAKNRMAEQNPSGVGGGGISLGGGGSVGSSVSAASASNLPNRAEIAQQVQDSMYLESFLRAKNETAEEDGANGLVSTGPAAAEQLWTALVQEVVSSAEDNHGGEPEQWYAACGLIRQCMDQMVQVARVVGLGRGKKPKGKGNAGVTLEDYHQAWQTVSNFAVMVMTHVTREVPHTVRPTLADDTFFVSMRLLAMRWVAEKAAQVFLMAAWMQPPPDGAHSTTVVNLHKALAILTFWNEIRSQSVEAQRAKREAASLIGDGNHGGEGHATMAAAAAAAAAMQSALCRWRMATLGSPPTKGDDEDTWIREAARSSQNASLDATFGTAPWQCLLLWCGLHRNSWPTCTVTEARRMVRQAREAMEQAEKRWGRPVSQNEVILLDLASADAEGGYLAGGYLPDAALLYRRVHQQLEDVSFPKPMKTLLAAHCKAGLSRVAYAQFSNAGGGGVDVDVGDLSSVAAKDLARSSLELVESLLSDDEQEDSLWFWSHPTYAKRAVAHQISTARQSLSKALLKEGRMEDALQLLTSAVRDAPTDVEARLALGAFYLHMEVYRPPAGQNTTRAQFTLLEAAKLSPSRSEPFALLGLFYEVKCDEKRALGCYSKALVLDPTNPIAGRGLLRLRPFVTVRHVCHKATTSAGGLVGWAWFALARAQALMEGNDEVAIDYYQKALRCRDVGNAKAVALSEFYQLPGQEGGEEEVVRLWFDLAASFQRVGKYYAALRAYHAAVDVASGDGGAVVSADMLCDWAQAELHLGLHEQAMSRMDQATQRVACEENSSVVSRVAMYIRGLASLSLARQLSLEGKYSASLAVLEGSAHGMQSTLDLTDPTHVWRCEWKLLGDLYSLAASLKHDERSLEFCRQGQEAYRKGLERLPKRGPVSNDKKTAAAALQRAAAHCDVGMSLLQQVRNSKKKKEEKDVLSSRAISSWLQAMEEDPCFPPAWSGLGCSLVTINPILSQHALVRCLELDRLHSDAWLILCVLCAACGATQPSLALMDASAEIMETSVAWILRALLFQSKNKEQQQQQQQVADAFRSALQRENHSLALLGLSVVTMMAAVDREKSALASFRVESRAAFQTFCSASRLVDHDDDKDDDDDLARSFGSILSAQEAMERLFEQGSMGSAHVVLQSALDKIQPGDSGAANAVVRQVAEHLDKLGESKGGNKTLQEPKEGNNGLSISELQRQLRENPSNALWWLQLAHVVISQMSGKKERVSLDTASRAANRAVLLLNSSGSAKMLSKAVALSSVCRYATAGEAEAEAANMQMQQAIMLDPTNPVARSWASQGGFCAVKAVGE